MVGEKKGGGPFWKPFSFSKVRFPLPPGRGDLTLEKEEGFQFQTSQGMHGKTGAPGREPISRMLRKPYDINLDEGFTARKTKQPENKDRETDRQTDTKRQTQRELHMRTYTLTHTHSHVRTIAVLWWRDGGGGGGGKKKAYIFNSIFKA